MNTGLLMRTMQYIEERRLMSEFSNLAVYWTTRPIGLDTTPGCFVCGVTSRNDNPGDYMNNIAAHVKKVDEAAALACFERGARMDYYHGDKESPQIKVGTCDKHLDVLKYLQEQWFISAYRINQLVQVVLRREEWEAKNASKPSLR